MESLNQQNTFENREGVVCETKIFSPDELIEIIYQGTALPQNRRFLSFEAGGVFKYFDPANITSISRFPSKKLFLATYESNTPVGLSELEQDPRDSKNFWIKFVSVDPSYQGKGYASMLLRKIFQFAKDNDYTLEPSFYSEQGLQKLKGVIEKLCIETGVKLISRNNS